MGNVRRYRFIKNNFDNASNTRDKHDNNDKKQSPLVKLCEGLLIIEQNDL